LTLQDAWPGAKIVLVHSRGAVVREHGSWAAFPFYELFIERLSDQLREGLKQTQWLAFRSMLRPEAATSSGLEALARAELVHIYEQFQHLIVRQGLDDARLTDPYIVRDGSGTGATMAKIRQLTPEERERVERWALAKAHSERSSDHVKVVVYGFTDADGRAHYTVIRTERGTISPEDIST
jgi:hypothetical protein